MSRGIIITFHSGKEELNKLITRLVLLKVTSEMDLEKTYNNIHAITIHREK